MGTRAFTPPDTPDFQPRSPRNPAEASRRIGLLRDAARDSHPDEKRLWARLLELGGDAVAPVYERDAGALLRRGKLFSGPVRMRCGKARECHRNASTLWREDPRLTLCPGWALSWDTDGVGCWRQHSFLWDARKRTIIETTIPRHAYFGIALTAAEAEIFADDVGV